MSCHFLPALLVMSGGNAALKSNGASLNETALSEFNVVIPDSVKFSQSKQALAAKRTAVKVRAENQSYASNNNRQIRILAPNNALYDTRYGYLTFDLALARTGGTYGRLANGVFSVFDRLYLTFGSAVVEDLRDYNRVQNYIWFSTQRAAVTASIGMSMGFGTQAERNAAGLITKSYAMPIYSGILNTELLPFQSVNGGLIIDLYIGDTSTFVETDGTLPIVTISNVLLHIERLELELSYLQFVQNYISKNGLQFGFCSYERYVNALTTGSQQTLNINCRASSVDGFFNLFVDSSTISSLATNDKFTNWTNIGLTQYNVLINGSIYPDEPIDCLTNQAFEAWQIYARNQQKFQLNELIPLETAIPWSTFSVIPVAGTNNQFTFILDMQPYPEDAHVGLINPFTTLGNNATINLKLQFSGVIAANLQCDTWVRYFKQVDIYRNGQVRVMQ